MFTESLTEALRLRFGGDPGGDWNGLESFLGHRSIRHYSDKPIADETIMALIGCAQSAATSSNLQLWSVISVQDPERRQKIAGMCANQQQVLTAPWLLIFLADHHRLAKVAMAHGEHSDGLDFAEFCLMAIADASLAAERLVCAAESIGIGICYIGAARNDPPAISDFLELPDQSFAVFGLCLGYPDENRPAHIKPRLHPNAVWFRERYDDNPPVEEYNDRMREFYETEGMKGEFNWAQRSGRRIDGKHMTGRDVLKDWLAQRGFWRR